MFLNAQMLKLCNHSDHQVSNDDENNHTQQREPVGKKHSVSREQVLPQD